jgi:hypothetical protein
VRHNIANDFKGLLLRLSGGRKAIRATAKGNCMMDKILYYLRHGQYYGGGMGYRARPMNEGKQL